MPDETPKIRQWELQHDDIPDELIQEDPLDNLYATNLDPEDEREFMSFWHDYHTLFPKRIPANPDELGQYYDVRGWWQEYAKNNPNFFLEAMVNPSQHGTDKYKLPGHPTYSTQSKNYYPGQEQITRVSEWDPKTGKAVDLNPFL